MKHFTFLLGAALAVWASGCRVESEQVEDVRTFCNPINISYRFCLDEPSRREAADPSIVLYKDEYWLFLSKSGGYFHSKDLINWDLVTTEDLPIESYAPTAVVINDELYFITSGDTRLFKTSDPLSGKWQFVTEIPVTQWDPMLFADDDGRVYFYWGCSNNEPIRGVELDKTTFQPLGEPVALIHHHSEKYGWERTGDYNDGVLEPLPGAVTEGRLDANGEKKNYNEGAWMNKHDGRYYLQYATPGTEFKSYNDAVYVSGKPLGPYTVSRVNPFAYKPEGFANGAGHGSTFQDRYGNYWHIGTVTIARKHMFERRLSIFPVFFDADGYMSACTSFGDYPFIVPDGKVEDVRTLSAGWMLLSYNKPAVTSSYIDGYEAANALNEDIRSYWSARTGDKGEFISIDLERVATIHAIQINFAEHNTTQLGRREGLAHQYILDCSVDGDNWIVLSDKSQSINDLPHDYIQLEKPVKARYVRLTNVRMPDGCFALSGLRVFGLAGGKKPQAVKNLTVQRLDDRRAARLTWDKSPDATGYNIRFGIQPDKLYQSYMVYGDTATVTIRSLNADEQYHFSIEAFNESGITPPVLSKIR